MRDMVSSGFRQCCFMLLQLWIRSAQDAMARGKLVYVIMYVTIWKNLDMVGSLRHAVGREHCRVSGVLLNSVPPQ